MGHYSCCVISCKNTGRNSQCKFYVFPKAAWKLEQRMKWIAAVKRKNVDGSPWYPKPDDKICSAHFIGGKKSDAQASPSYVPTIFPKVYRKRTIDESQILTRYTRLMKRRTAKAADTTLKVVSNNTKNEIIVEEGNGLHQTQPRLIEKKRYLNNETQSNVPKKWKRVQDETSQIGLHTEITESNQPRPPPQKIEEVNVPNESFADYMMTPCRLKVCRVCFATNCKLYPITMKLDKAYKMLTGLSVKNEDNLPPYLCSECTQRLLNSIRFRTRSLQAHLIILEVIKRNEEVTLESIKSVVGEWRIGAKLSVTHNETDHYDVEIQHGVEENVDNVIHEVKEENDVITCTDNTSEDAVYLPVTGEYEVEYDVKDEEDVDEVASQGSVLYANRADDDTDIIIDEFKIEINCLTDDEKEEDSNLEENTVAKELISCDNIPFTDKNIVNDKDKECRRKVPGTQDVADNDVINLDRCDDEVMNSNNRECDKGRDITTKMSVNNDISTSNDDTIK